MKEQYSSATTMNGELCVIIYGMMSMQLWSVDNLDISVSGKKCIGITYKFTTHRWYCSGCSLLWIWKWGNSV